MKTQEKIMNFLKNNGWMSIPVVFGIIFVMNHPFSSIIGGGDSFPLFYTSNFIFEQAYVWLNSISYGAVGGTSFYILLWPYIFLLDICKNIFGDFLASYLYFWGIFILAPLGVYFLMRVLKFQKSTAIFMGFFYGLNFLTWSALTRNVIHITNLFVFTPIIIAFFLLFLETNSKKYLAFLLIFGIFNIFIIANPWTFGIQLLMIGIFLLPHLRKNFKKIFVGTLSLYIFALPGLVGLFTMLFNSQNLVADDWNNKVLKEGSIKIELKNSNILNTLRGFNGDLFADWGYVDYTKSDEKYTPFVYNDFYKSQMVDIVSFIPLVLIFLWMIFFLKNDRKILFWILVFFVSFFLFKGVGRPFGEAFRYCLENIPMCGIFRSPHQKFSIIFLISIIILLAIIRDKITKKIPKMCYDFFLGAYVVIMGSFLFFTPYIARVNIMENIPETYKESAKMANENADIKNIIVLPFNESTWTNTEFWFEGYSLFASLLPQKQVYNRNDLAFSWYAKNIHTILGPALKNRDNNIVDLMRQYNIDTIIYDGYTDRFTRFAYREEHEENIRFLNGVDGLKKMGTFGKIHIYSIPSLPTVIAKNAIYQKQNPTKYSVTIKNLTEQNLFFLQNFHSNWKIFPEKYRENSCESVTREAILPQQTEAYIVQKNDSLEEILSKNGVSFSDMKKVNFLENLENLREGSVLQIPKNAPLKSYSVGECSPKNIFSPSDISVLWRKSLFENTHKMDYWYMNAWRLDAESIKENFSSEYYRENPDGSIDVQLTIYFQPQSYFYLAIIISSVAFLCAIWFLWFSWYRMKNPNLKP